MSEQQIKNLIAAARAVVSVWEKDADGTWFLTSTEEYAGRLVERLVNVLDP